MKLLVTGATGTIGVYVVRDLLGLGHEITAFAQASSAWFDGPFIAGDVTDFDSLLAAARNHDAIVHLAAIPGPGRTTPERLVKENIAGLMNVLESALRSGMRKVVFASSAAVLGFSFQRSELIPSYFPVDEQHECRPHDPYGLSKLLGEIACKSYSDAFGIQTICLRLNNVWYTDQEGAELVVRSGWRRE